MRSAFQLHSSPCSYQTRPSQNSLVIVPRDHLAFRDKHFTRKHGHVTSCGTSVAACYSSWNLIRRRGTKAHQTRHPGDADYQGLRHQADSEGKWYRRSQRDVLACATSPQCSMCYSSICRCYPSRFATLAITSDGACYCH